MKNNFMKKILTVLVLGFFFFSATPVFASSFDVYAEKTTIKKGDFVTVSVSVAPQSSTIYTAKLNLKFPADMLSIDSWNFGSGWSALSQPGYDSVDNTNGVLIKTAGYPGGLSSGKVFGTIHFRALKDGSANVFVTDSAALYDDQSKNALQAKGAVVFTIVTVKKVEPVIERKLTRPATTTKSEKIAAEIATTSEEDTVATSTLDNATSTEETILSNTENMQADVELFNKNFFDTLYFSTAIVLSFIVGFIAGHGNKRRIKSIKRKK